jgi:fatty acid desaturase
MDSETKRRRETRSVLITAALIGAALALIGHYGDGYPWLNCISFGVAVAIASAAVISVALTRK